MLKLNRVISAFIIATALYVLAYAEESLTITTYYPSPYGAYREMRVDQMSVGSGYRGSALSDGNLLVEGKLGIGTLTPFAPLEVNGTIRATSMEDRDNLSYNVDPAGTSNFSELNAGTIDVTELDADCISLSGDRKCAWPSGGGHSA